MNKNITKKIAIHLHVDDNIAIACESLNIGDTILLNKREISIQNGINLAHKFAYQDIKKFDKIIKFGATIGSAIKDIKEGEHVHLHNIKSDYIRTESY